MAQQKQLTVDADKAEDLAAISTMDLESLKILHSKIKKHGTAKLASKLKQYKAFI